ncbi:acyl-CoA dehydrogenase family protein [Streptomyces sp. NPDC047841]|uniref:acyl-CoA dehydrogenase family protein n=1 Tax=Streptomyces sp. NPDC047841 TaxID=3154708 RepID=UPI0034551138
MDPARHEEHGAPGARADLLVVSAANDAGTGLFLVPAEQATRHGYRTYDGGRAAALTLAPTPATSLGTPGTDHTPMIDRVTAHALVAQCREAIGAMDSALRITTDHLRSRRQFGVRLRAADMYVSVELARNTTLWATMVLAEADCDVMEVASRAKLQVSRAARHIIQEAVQLHGAIGLTAEYSIGHHMTGSPRSTTSSATATTTSGSSPAHSATTASSNRSPTRPEAERRKHNLAPLAAGGGRTDLCPAPRLPPLRVR